jgi:N-acetyl-anhydromuramyl-L-alanine amidase AmpD
MKNHPIYQKALKTNKLTKSEADLFISDLTAETDKYIRENWKYYVNKGMWPLRARIKNKAQKDPVFIVNHCTGAKDGRFEPALHRFFQAEQASANAVVTLTGELILLVPLTDLAFHATRRSGVILGALAKLLKIDDGKWLNEPGIEVVGSGNHCYFTPEQFEASIVLQRVMKAYFNESVKDIKSHRFFSPVDRKGDPGCLYFLPLVKHAIFNNVDITSKNYWLEEYRLGKKIFALDFNNQLKKYGIPESEDEWAVERKKLKLPE